MTLISPSSRTQLPSAQNLSPARPTQDEASSGAAHRPGESPAWQPERSEGASAPDASQQQPTYDGCLPNFLLPRSAARKKVQGIAEFFASPSVLEEDIACLKSEIAEHQKGIAEAEEDLERKNFALAVAYARPEYDRRVSDEPNVTDFEFICRIIEPSCKLLITTSELAWIYWETDGEVLRTIPQYSQQEAWASAFRLLDRRSAVKS